MTVWDTSFVAESGRSVAPILAEKRQSCSRWAGCFLLLFGRGLGLGLDPRTASTTQDLSLLAKNARSATPTRLNDFRRLFEAEAAAATEAEADCWMADGWIPELPPGPRGVVEQIPAS